MFIKLYEIYIKVIEVNIRYYFCSTDLSLSNGRLHYIVFAGASNFTMNILTKMSSSKVREGTVVHLSSKAWSLYSSMDTEKFPSSVFRVIVLQGSVR